MATPESMSFETRQIAFWHKFWVQIAEEILEDLDLVLLHLIHLVHLSLNDSSSQTDVTNLSQTMTSLQSELATLRRESEAMP